MSQSCVREKKKQIFLFIVKTRSKMISHAHIFTELCRSRRVNDGDSFISNDVRLLIDYKNKALLSLHMLQCQC
mgnify:CR=1 FL=1